MAAPPGTAAAEFHCRPLSSTAERAAFFDLQGFTHKIATRSPEAQALFDQGLLLSYNFNRPEAAKSFQAGLAVDPDGAPMLYWGLAHAQGPYANKVFGEPPADGSYPVMTEAELDAAKQASQAGLAAARAAVARASRDGDAEGVRRAAAELSYLQAEAALWGGLSSASDGRYVSLLRRYAEDLEAIARAQPADPDAPALAAESRMGLSPWVHWRGPLGRRTPVQARTVVGPALADIASALERSPGHPLAAHLMIHLAEGGTPGDSRDVPATPGFAALGEAAADLLAAGPAGAYPDQGHLVHMPSHIYLRVGRWADAVHSNQLALAADEALAQRCVEPYMPGHNSAMLLYAASTSGQLAAAEAAALREVESPRLFGPTNMSDGRERTNLPLIQARWARWAPILALQPSDLDYSRDGVMTPPGTPQFSQGVWHFTRALAFASAAAHEADGEAAARATQQMGQELAGLEAAVRDTPPDPLTRPGEGIGIYSPGFKRLGAIELAVARARADVLRGDLAAAVPRLTAAVATEASFGYTEPPRQPQPVRECLGWVLLQLGRLADAEQVYADDLAEYPNSPWPLTGLVQVYRQQPGSESKLQQAEARLAESWAHADAGLTLPSSCPAFSE